MLGRFRSLLFGPPFDPSSLRATMSSATNASTEIATFAAGCFWGVEHIFLKHFPPKENKGIIKTAVGYTGGKETVTNPGYRDVCSGETDHAEALRIEFDPTIVSYADLVEFFYRTHEPTTVNRQGNDRGTQYRSAIFANTPKQLETALAVTEEVQQKRFTPKGEKIVTQIIEAGPWYDAEDYHQLYLFKNPNGYQCATHRLHW
ncbi:MAG: peptide methionine sulfoxide reductase [Lentinula lateritia]|uniref:peptide-methionine (S)-S-oxide reductase n=1 Tax=Lentinula lateritia TaxID=40482 RepID=A0ABQ8VIE4_9AGAR|nr:MAG: peptide methionine sulfoxide reductase [Lentinula lateritia]KAJ4494238.1 peptide methionine sulfoxide reductase [Lentinula lateritia]